MFVGQCVPLERTGENVHTHVRCYAKGGPWLRIVFNRWDSGKGREGGWRGAEEGCMRVCCVRSGAAGGPAAVSSSSVCQQVNSPSIPAASRTSAKITGHAPLFTHSRFLSICSSTAADSFCFHFFFTPSFYLCVFSVCRCDTPHNSNSYWLSSFPGSRTVT